MWSFRIMFEKNFWKSKPLTAKRNESTAEYCLPSLSARKRVFAAGRLFSGLKLLFDERQLIVKLLPVTRYWLQSVVDCFKRVRHVPVRGMIIDAVNAPVARLLLPAQQPTINLIVIWGNLDGVSTALARNSSALRVKLVSRLIATIIARLGIQRPSERYRNPRDCGQIKNLRQVES